MSENHGPGGRDTPTSTDDTHDDPPADMMADDSASESEETAADYFVTRDEQGNLNTVTEQAGNYGEVTIRPMTYGHAERYFGDAGSATMVGPDVVAEIIRNHIVDPDFEAFAEQKYGLDEGHGHAFNERVVSQEMEPFAPMMLLTAVFNASGLSPDIDMNTAGEASIDFESELEQGGN